MTGIYLLFVSAVWLLIVIGLTALFTKKLPEKWWRLVVRALIFFALLPLPLTDEIIGRQQFEKLCQENSTIQVDRVTAVGKTVYLADLPDIQIKGTWVPIRLQPWRFVDVATGASVVSYNEFHPSGGWFFRAFSAAPLTFESSCGAGGFDESLKLFKELGIKRIQRSELNIKERT